MTYQTTFFDGIADTDAVKKTAARRKSQPEPLQPPGKGPTKSKRKSDCQEILKVLRQCDSVSSLRLREMLPASLTQRISDLRADGYKIDCQQASGSACGLYTLKNKNHVGKKF